MCAEREREHHHLSSETLSLPGPRNETPGPDWSEKMENRLEKACRAMLVVLWSSWPSPGTWACFANTAS